MQLTSGMRRVVMDNPVIMAAHASSANSGRTDSPYPERDEHLLTGLADLSIVQMNFQELVQFGRLTQAEQARQIKQVLQRFKGPTEDPALLDQAGIPVFIKAKWLSFYSSPGWHILNWLQRVLALILALLVSPILIIIAVAIRVTSSGPIIFKQERLGWLCRPFTLYKFRTMVDDAEAGTGPVWASKGDPRYTRIGRLLRATRLDEVPQLFNIVKGDMSLIGFRPIRYHFAHLIDQHVPHYELRFFVMPGITGWPQVWHDYAGSIEGQKKKFEYELHYLMWSNWRTNIEIIPRTALAVIRRIGQ